MSYKFRRDGMRFAQLKKYLSFSGEKLNLPGKDSFRPVTDGNLYPQRTAEGSKLDII